MNKNILRLSILLGIFFLASCSKEDDPYIPSDLCRLSSITFRAADNDGLTTNVMGRFGHENSIYFTIPEGVALNSLVMTVDMSEGATASIDGTQITSGQTALDCSKTLALTITSESGRTNKFNLLVQNGRDAFDNQIYQFMKDYDIPGMSFAFARDQKIQYASAYGFAVKSTMERTRPDHLFRLASVSKQFTTLCIMTLIEEGKLDLNATIFGKGGILEAEFPTGVSAKAATVTVKHCLQHTTGWVSDPDPMFTSSFSDMNLNERINYMLQSSQGVPGGAYSYYNMGFGVLGKIIEKITGTDYETYLKSVLAKAGITDIHVGKGQEGRRANECVYYSQSGTNGYGNNMEVIKAAGGVIASAPQMMELMLHIDGRDQVPDILLPETRNLMLTPCDVYNRYALGWRCNHSYFPGSYYHSGNLAGTAAMWVMGGDGVNCVVLCNSRSYAELAGRGDFDDEFYGLVRNLWNLAH